MGKVVFIKSDSIGDGELGLKLMQSFLYSLARTDKKPSAIFLMNAGVRLSCEGSDALESLGMLAADGVEVRSCGTCLSYYELTDRLAVGEVGNMNDTAGAFMDASDVVSVG